MTIGKSSLLSVARRLPGIYTQPQFLNPAKNLIATLTLCRFISHHHITKNINFVSQDNKIIKTGHEMRKLEGEKHRPLLVILCWLMAKQPHIMKFANLYLEQGFDVVTISITPWQLLWPAKGSRLVAEDLLKFLIENQNYQQILLHGFSVGGYLWGETMDLIQQDRKKYDNVVNRIVGQVWDSVADLTEISIGTPRAVFPQNPVLQTMLKKYLEYHMRTFHDQSTQYYIRSSQLFHSTLVRSPALLIVSDTDQVGTMKSNMALRDTWDSLGIQTYMKIFEKSPHVGHFRKYPKDYVAELYAFLSKLSLIQNEEKIRSRL